MGIQYNQFLKSSTHIYGCKNCKTHLSTDECLMSKSFRGQHGKAFLFGNVTNINEDQPMERNMLTGKHIVRDIKCRSCHAVVGWKYDRAFEMSEKYKEGKFILEQECITHV